MSPPTPATALVFDPEKWFSLPTQMQHTSTSPKLVSALAPTSWCQKTSQYLPTTDPYSPFLKSSEMSCRQLLDPNWQALSYFPRKWSLSGKLSTKWADHSQNHPFSVKIQLPWEWPIKPSFHKNQVDGHAIPLASLQRLTIPVKIILGSRIPESWILKHQELPSHLSPLSEKNQTSCNLPPNADWYSLNCSIDSRQGCIDPV